MLASSGTKDQVREGEASTSEHSQSLSPGRTAACSEGVSRFHPEVLRGSASGTLLREILVWRGGQPAGLADVRGSPLCSA